MCGRRNGRYGPNAIVQRRTLEGELSPALSRMGSSTQFYTEPADDTDGTEEKPAQGVWLNCDFHHGARASASFAAHRHGQGHGQTCRVSL
jgi:hypothetical protein